MSRMKCTEAVYDVLVGAGLKADHASFDDLIMGCVGAAVDPVMQGADPVAVIAKLDEERAEVVICLDLLEYARESGFKGDFDKLLRDAVEAGRKGWAE